MLYETVKLAKHYRKKSSFVAMLSKISGMGPKNTALEPIPEVKLQ